MSRTAIPQPLAVTARQAAQMLSISERSLWELWHRGELPRVQVGRSVRYSVEDLRAYISGQRRNATAVTGGRS